MQVLFDKDAHGKTVESLVESFETDVIRGLSSAEAKARLTQIGGNELREQPRPGFLALLWDQFNNYLVIILIAAAIISFVLVFPTLPEMPTTLISRERR